MVMNEYSKSHASFSILKQKRENLGHQNNVIDQIAKIKGRQN